ncbi:MAG: sugar phosphate isomerase/epimerase family protein [Armatimonadota bacterium]
MSEPLRLGVSSSAFIHVMPREVVEAMLSFVKDGSPSKLDDRLNRMMADFTRDMMSAINPSEIAALECYHSTIWDVDQVLEPILEKPNVELWSVHAPYSRQFDPSSPNSDIREAAVDAYCVAVDVAKRIGAKVVVTHPGTQAEYDMPKRQRLELIPHVIRKVADYAAQYGIKIAVEPLPKHEPGNSLEEVLWVLDQIDKPNVGINFDVNHLFPASAIPDLIRKAGKLIMSVHISDQDDTERHWLPLEGKLDWGAVLETLTEVGYDGPLIYESHIKNASSCKEIARMVVDNYQKLMKLPLSRADYANINQQTV